MNDDVLKQWEAEANLIQNSGTVFGYDLRDGKHFTCNQLAAQILALIDLVRKKDEALRLYANKEMWALSGSLGNRRIFAQLKPWGDGLCDLEKFEVKNSVGPVEHGYVLIYEIGGKRAREALALGPQGEEK